jgi:hypothetical protein
MHAVEIFEEPNFENRDKGSATIFRYYIYTGQVTCFPKKICRGSLALKDLKRATYTRMTSNCVVSKKAACFNKLLPTLLHAYKL